MQRGLPLETFMKYAVEREVLPVVGNIAKAEEWQEHPTRERVIVGPQNPSVGKM